MKDFKFLDKDKISKLPKTSGVYALKKGAKRGARLRREGGGGVGVLYIGKATNIRERVKNHFQQPGYRDYLFLDKVKKIGYIKTDSEIEALILEANLIKKYQPKYNVVWRDDKNYFFVVKAEEGFPRIFITHQPIRAPSSSTRPGLVGPFVDGRALKETLKTLRKVFPYRSCNKIPDRPCLWYHLNRCPAPCLLKSKIFKEINNGSRTSIILREECQRNAKNLMKIIQKGKIQVLKDLKGEMKLAARNQDFEEAVKIRDQIWALEKVLAHAKIFESVEEPVGVRPQQFQLQKILQEILKTERRISRIEAYDVSNIQGQEATGSMVTFIEGSPDKSFYRKFKIKITGKPNDVAMIKEVLKRRFSHPEWGYPDLILIDGGRAQLNAALQCLTSGVKQVKVVALAKEKNELYIENQKKPILLKRVPAKAGAREIFNLILQLRDEAHRFAISYHKKLRTKALLEE